MKNNKLNIESKWWCMWEIMEDEEIIILKLYKYNKLLKDIDGNFRIL